MPEVIQNAGTRLIDVGCTNKTCLSDYEKARAEDTVAIIRCHPSNFRLIGFVEEPSPRELAECAHKLGLLPIADVASARLVDPRRFGPGRGTDVARLTRREHRMSDQMEFASNYSDLSTDKGFQFEFNCNRCSNGFRTRFQPWVVGSVSGVLDAAGSLLGGVFSSAADVGERVRSAGWQKAHDEAFAAAVAEMRPNFIQCPRCSQWVCRKSCWNAKRGLCKECAPDLGVEMSAAQASRSVEGVWAAAKMDEEDRRSAESPAGLARLMLLPPAAVPESC